MKGKRATQPNKEVRKRKGRIMKQRSQERTKTKKPKESVRGGLEC